MKKLSVIIPVYNVAEFLSECLDSIVPQLSDDTELIIIDDASTDGTVEIISGYLSKYDKIRFYQHAKNKGQGAARNLGLEKAAGNFVWFVDGDDYVESYSIKTLLKSINQRNPPDILRFGYYKFESATQKIENKISFRPVDKVDSKTYFSKNEMMDEVCMGVYNRTFLDRHNLKFLTGFVYEDTIFNLQAYHKQAKISVLPDILYYYRLRQGSTTNSPTNQKKIRSVTKLLHVCSQLIMSSDQKIFEASLASRKMLDYTFLLVDHLFLLESASFNKKMYSFLKNKQEIPFFKADSPGIKVTKIILNRFPGLFFCLRYLGLFLKINRPNI